jgi:hypothetical protein
MTCKVLSGWSMTWRAKPGVADLAVTNTLENNRSVKMMEKINRVVNWQNIEALLLEYYEQGKSTQGADAYPPLMLFKALLVKKSLRLLVHLAERISTSTWKSLRHKTSHQRLCIQFMQ